VDDLIIIATYEIIVETMRHLGHQSHCLARATDGDVLLVAVVAARYFQNNHERALCVLKGMRYITAPLSTSRFSRRLHKLADWLELLLEAIGAIYAQEDVFIIDSLPVPVCQRVRAFRCRKLNARHPHGRCYFHRCAAKKWNFFGWRLHLVVTPAGVPVAFQLLPAAWPDLTPIYELTVGLRHRASVYGDKAYICALVKRSLRPTTRRQGVDLVALHKKNMRPNSLAERAGLRAYRHLIETANAQLESMGIQRLHARTNAGLAIKVLASLLALAVTNMN
jgi:hypothetical protein